MPKPKHRITIAYIGPDELVHNTAIRIDKITDKLPQVIDGYIAQERGGSVISYRIEW